MTALQWKTIPTTQNSDHSFSYALDLTTFYSACSSYFACAYLLDKRCKVKFSLILETIIIWHLFLDTYFFTVHYEEGNEVDIYTRK